MIFFADFMLIIFNFLTTFVELGFLFESLLPYFEKHIYCSLADIFDH